MVYPAKEIVQNFLSVVAGAIVALLIIIPSGIIVFLIRFSFSEISTFQQIISITILISGILTGTFMGGYTTAKISTRKTKIHVCITGFVLIVLLLLFSDVRSDFFTLYEIIILLVLFPSTFIGGLYGIKKKQAATSAF